MIWGTSVLGGAGHLLLLALGRRASADPDWAKRVWALQAPRCGFRLVVEAVALRG
jgi:hypothetical protein